MEYAKDRLNYEIQKLKRENADLRDVIFRKEQKIMDLNLELKEKEQYILFISTCVGVMAAVAVALIFYVAMR